MRNRLLIVSALIALLCSFVLSPPVCEALANRVLAVQNGISAESRFVKLDEHRIHYKNKGRGREALVFVHGWTCNLEFWDGQAGGFDNKRIILIDLPGHGQSDKPKTAYTMDLFADAVAAVLRDAGVDRAVLVGHSMGTPVIRQLYRKHPAKVLGLVMVDGVLRPFAPKEQMEAFIAPLRGPNYQQAATAFVDGMLGPVVSPELKQRIKQSMLGTPQHVAIEAMDGMMEDSLWKPDRINAPVLAVMAKSPFLAPDYEQFLKGIAPNLDYRMWDGVSHFLMMEKPKEFNDAVREFLAKNKLLTK